MPAGDRTAINSLLGQTLDRRFRLEVLMREALGVQELVAHDGATGLPVVVGAIQGAGAGEDLRSRIEFELRLLQEHPSPHLAALTHVGGRSDLVYAVRPHVAGTLLSERLREGPLDIEEAVLVVRDVLLGLATLHGLSLVHLDVQPGAVIVGEAADHGVLAYLGLARGVPASHHDLDASAVRHLSPEQAGLIQAPVDARSDLYSVGALLFECLGGRPPFEGETVGDVLRAHLSPRTPEIAS